MAKLQYLISASDVVVPYSDVMNMNSPKNMDLPQRNSGVNQSKVNSLFPSAMIHQRRWAKWQ